jgi:hypothetical protein
VLVASAGNPAEAQVWVDMLRDEGILATSIDRSVRAALGGMGLVTPRIYVMVNRADLLEARNIIAEAGGASALAPVPAEGEGRDRMVTALFMVGGALALFLLFAAMLQSA